MRLSGTKLKELRRKRGLSQEALARRAGLDVRTLRRLEQDKSQPQPATLKALADSLGADTDSLQVASGAAGQVPTFVRRPALAVLPFVNLSDDREQELFADGITGDLIGRLSAQGWLPVISRSSTYEYKGKQTDARQVAKELGAAYVVDGTVRRVGDQIRVSAQLIDGATGQNVWAAHYDCALREVLALQDQITLAICGAIRPELKAFEPQRALRRPGASVDAWELFQRGSWYTHRGSLAQGTREDVERGRELLQQALQLDPDFASPLGYIALGHLLEADRRWTSNPVEARRLALAVAKKAVMVDSLNPDLWHILGSVYLQDGELQSAIDAHERAIRLDPSHAWAYQGLGMALVQCGRDEEATRMFATSARLHPKGQGAAAAQAAACFSAGKYAQAARHIEQGRSPSVNERVLLIAAYGHLGRGTDARAELQRLLDVAPRTSLERIQRFASRMAPAYVDRLVDGLRKAGLG